MMKKGRCELGILLMKEEASLRILETLKQLGHFTKNFMPINFVEIDNVLTKLTKEVDNLNSHK